jgi:hypothetical protein
VHGGGAVFDHTVFSSFSTSFTNNTAASCAGAYFANTTAKLLNSFFTFNKATGVGGGFYVVGGNVTIDGALVELNNAMGMCLLISQKSKRKEKVLSFLFFITMPQGWKGDFRASCNAARFQCGEKMKNLMFTNEKN